MGGPGSGRRKKVEDAGPPATTVSSQTTVPELKVKSPAGAEVSVRGKAEKRFYEQARDAYLRENEFTAAGEPWAEADDDGNLVVRNTQSADS